MYQVSHHLRWENDKQLNVSDIDWYHNQSRVNAAWFLSKQNPDAVEPLPRKWYFIQCLSEKIILTTCAIESGIVNDQSDAKFYFEPGKTYRMRLLNMAGFTTFYYSIDGHEFDIIETDGVSCHDFWYACLLTYCIGFDWTLSNQECLLDCGSTHVNSCQGQRKNRFELLDAFRYGSKPVWSPTGWS